MNWIAGFVHVKVFDQSWNFQSGLSEKGKKDLHEKAGR